MRPWQRAKDGRQAYLALYQHYLGASSVDNMSSLAEKNLKYAVYKGESKKFTFKKYVRIHMDQHQILNDLKDHGYAGIDDRSKVCHLQEGIKTSSLDSVKNTILDSSTLRSDLTACVALYTDFIQQATIANDNQSLLIAGLETGGRGARGGRGGRGNQMAAPIRCDDRL